MKQTTKKSPWLRLGLALALFITLYGSLDIPASAQPPLPHAFYGTVEIAGQPAPAGTTVEARSGGTYILPDMGNPMTTTEAGKYGGPGPLDGKLYVQGDLADGDELEFYVNEMRAQCYVDGAWVDTFPYEEGGVTELNLRTEAAEPTPGPSPTPQPTPTPTATSKPSTPGPSPTSAPGLSPTPAATPGGESEGPSALLWVAIVALVVLGIAAIAFGVWGLKRRGAE